jgi:lipopolysaccharide assembly protein A
MPFFFGSFRFFLMYGASCATLRIWGFSQYRTTLMKLISTIAGFILFALFFGFALKNTQEVDLHFFLNVELRGPLVLMLLAFFVAGAFLGILALTPTVFRHRRETTKHKTTIDALRSVARKGKTQPAPDSVNTQQ